jgi:CHAT domain-containing protein/tetratricopeptide (TPR) repeat protein
LGRSFSQHVDQRELARLLEMSRTNEATSDPADVHPHFAVCTGCRQKFEELVLSDRQFTRQLAAKSSGPQPRSSDCPSPSVWREIAGGLTPSDEALNRVEHASWCDHCGPLLRQAVADVASLNGEITDEERKQIAALESAHPDWQRTLARQLAAAPDQFTRPLKWWQSWYSPHRPGIDSVGHRVAIAGACLVLVAMIGVGWRFVANRNQPGTAAKLIARAYTEKRPLDLRIAGADYAPLRIARGPESSFTSRPPSLLKAEALIAAQIASHPSDPAWLHAQGQADLLEGRDDAAIDALHRALELEPHSSAFLIDLASAYFQRAESDERKDDLGAAYECLSQALKLHPDDPVALFNRAIVAEHQFLFHQALDDWDHYLTVDPHSQWTDEARKRSDALRQKLKDHESHAGPLLSPGQVAAAATDPKIASVIDQRVEEYLNEAIVSWLPQVFPDAASSNKGIKATGPGVDPAVSRAIFFLADLTSRQHGDRWLSDLLTGSSAPQFPRAVVALARAVKSNHAADYDVAREQAELAQRLFQSSGNGAGALRARFERVFVDQVSPRSEECRRKATTALVQSERFAYPWLQIQFGLEKAACSFRGIDIGADERATSLSLDRARISGYGALYLRAAYFAADDKLATGDRLLGTMLIDQGLERYWSAQLPALRGYAFYIGLADSAESARRVNLRAAAWGEGVPLLDGDPDLLQRALASHEFANAAMAAGLRQTAEREYAAASRLFAAAPRNRTREVGAIEVEILSARLEARMGRLDDGIARLIGVQDRVRGVSTKYLSQMFYSTLGELQLRRHRDAEAEQALQPALVLAEQGLTSLSSEEERTKWSKNAAPAYFALSEAELAQGRAQEALATYESYLGAPQRVATGVDHHPFLSRPSVPDALASGLPLLTSETVLAYAALPGGLAIWVYDNRGVNHCWIPQSIDSLQELADRFHDLTADPTSEPVAISRDSRSLYEALIAPAERYLAPGRSLVIEADGWLARVPFEALLDSNNHYLIERASIVHSLGQDSQELLRSRDTTSTGISSDLPALVVGSTASSKQDGLIPLSDVATEANTVAASFQSVRLLQGREATIGTIRSDLPGTVVFHFAGHALAAPQRTGLLVEGEGRAGDGRSATVALLDATAVRQLRLQSLQLAVLSACSTASSGRSSSGFDSVTDAFVRSGVPHVVATRWAVDSTETFIADFYRNALSGQNVSEAIRSTSRKMLADPRTSHPYYWSAFAAYGRP